MCAAAPQAHQHATDLAAAGGFARASRVGGGGDKATWRAPQASTRRGGGAMQFALPAGLFPEAGWADAWSKTTGPSFVPHVGMLRRAKGVAVPRQFSVLYVRSGGLVSALCSQRCVCVCVVRCPLRANRHPMLWSRQMSCVLAAQVRASNFRAPMVLARRAEIVGLEVGRFRTASGGSCHTFLTGGPRLALQRLLHSMWLRVATLAPRTTCALVERHCRCVCTAMSRLLWTWRAI